MARKLDFSKDGAMFRGNFGLKRDGYVEGGRCAQNYAAGDLMAGPRGGMYYMGSFGTKVYCRDVPKAPKAPKAPKDPKAVGPPDAPPTQFNKGTVVGGHRVTMVKKGAGFTKKWRKVRA